MMTEYPMPDNTSPTLPELPLLVDPGTAPPEVIAELLADISLIYRRLGGSGIAFRFEQIFVKEEVEV